MTEPKPKPTSAEMLLLEEAEREHEMERDIQRLGVNWKKYAELKFITPEESHMMIEYTKQTDWNDRVNLLDEQGKPYASLFVKILKVIADQQVIRFVLTLIREALRPDPAKPHLVSSKRAQNFHDIVSVQCNPYHEFMKHLEKGDEKTYQYEMTKACEILADILSSTGVASDCEEISGFLAWLCRKAVDGTARWSIVALTHLKTMLKSPRAQIKFVRPPINGVKHLATLLRREPRNIQQLYLTCFCVWLLADDVLMIRKHFEPIAETHFADEGADQAERQATTLLYVNMCADQFAMNDIVGALVEVLKAVSKEKVVRIIFEVLRHLMDFQEVREKKRDSKEGEFTYTSIMIGHGLAKLTNTLSMRKFEDPDLVANLQYVTDFLNKALKQLSSFDMYKNEIQSDQLDEGPVHSEEFWRDNFTKFETGNYPLIRMLIELLKKDHPTTLQIAANDLGEFARFHPEGKRIVEKWGGKPLLMKLMGHENPKVARAALLAVQKLLVKSWETLVRKPAAK